MDKINFNHEGHKADTKEKPKLKDARKIFASFVISIHKIILSDYLCRETLILFAV